ncbi:SUMO-interacting motif-containing protein 1 [Diretmus argenteus]
MEEGMDGKGMDDVISVSSGSEEYDSDVEIVDYTERNANLKRFGIRGDAVAGRSAEEKCGVGFRPPKVLCRQSLYLVYITSESGHWEETLETLSDLLQPGFYAPRDITCHLLQDILLNVRCPQHLCVKAFKLLMKTQRHHNADEDTVPWDWELLSSVMDNEDHTKRHRCQTVRIFLEYVMQTLEDDFQTKVSHSALHHSIAKANLSCDLQFPKVRMVSVFQRMLSLALRVDHSPAVSASKLSLELCHMLMSRVTSRAHRLLLLESLQSELLRYKLLEYLLDYACSKRIHRPMSISLVLHFLKDCTLTPDSMDGTERWQRWEELVNLLWMLLLSYKQVKDSVRALVHQPYDTVSRPAVREAVESFLSRSQADLGQALPLHVAESLTYLQDCLLNACQC